MSIASSLLILMRTMLMSIKGRGSVNSQLTLPMLRAVKSGWGPLSATCVLYLHNRNVQSASTVSMGLLESRKNPLFQAHRKGFMRSRVGCREASVQLLYVHRGVGLMGSLGMHCPACAHTQNTHFWTAAVRKYDQNENAERRYRGPLLRLIIFLLFFETLVHHMTCE